MRIWVKQHYRCPHPQKRPAMLLSPRPWHSDVVRMWQAIESTKLMMMMMMMIVVVMMMMVVMMVMVMVMVTMMVLVVDDG